MYASPCAATARQALPIGRQLLPRAHKQQQRTMAAAASESTINFDRVTERIFVGSCLRNAADAEKAQQAGVAVVFSLQDAADLAAQGIDSDAVAAACQAQGVRHVRCATSDTDEAELRRNLPAAVAAFSREVAAAAQQEGGGAAYIHCNGGRGRAPTVVTAFLFWLCGQGLAEAAAAMTAGRKSQPKLGVIAGATADLLGPAAGEGAAGAEERGKEELSAEERAAIAERLAQL